MLTPIRFIGDEIEVDFDEPPRLDEIAGLSVDDPLEEETLRIVELVNEWKDFTRRGRSARNMQPGHASTASRRGSWGVGRYFFQVRVEGGRFFELYYDRAPKGADDRAGSWFLRCELTEAPV